jgi:PleD family two-component response regulator
MIVLTWQAQSHDSKAGHRGKAMMAVKSREEKRILIIGRDSPLMEGVYDLLQVVGYPVQMSSSWTEIEYALYDIPPNLVIVDLSIAAPDVYRMAEQIHSAPKWARVPILFISFSGDDRIRELQRYTRKNSGGRLHFYAHTLLGMEELLDKIQSVCVESGEPVRV